MKPNPLFVLVILAILGIGLAFVDWSPHVDTHLDPANATALGVGLSAVLMIFILIKSGQASVRDFLPTTRGRK